jgi:GNAT superfamily N-acetyltransferase
VSDLQIRLLNKDDAAAYHALRMRSLREHPEAFGVAAEEEISGEQYTQMLENSLPDNPFFGAFLGGELVGITNIYRSTRIKMRHRVMISGMYVTPEVRGHGIGQKLLEQAIQYIRELGESAVKDIILAVTVGNDAARNLYLRARFQPYSVEPRFLKVGDRFHDIEWLMLSL